MATYGVNSQSSGQSLGVTYKGQVATWATTAGAKRHKWYEMIIGANGNPNSSDTYLQVDVSRLASTTSIAGTAFTPNATDPADGASVTVANVSQTTEPAAALVASSLMSFGLNQRNTTRWIAAQESQYLIAPSTNLNGLYLRAESNIYTSTMDCTVTFLE